MDLPDAVAPASVELDRARGLHVRWPDGREDRFALEDLRRNCTCASCRGRREQGQPVWPTAGAPTPLAATAAELVGGWGLRITWNDGHDTGIHAWSVLRAWADAARDPAAGGETVGAPDAGRGTGGQGADPR